MLLNFDDAFFQADTLKLMMFSIDPFMLNIFSHSYQLDVSVSNFRVVGSFYHFIQILKETSVSKQWKTRSDAAFCGV